MVSASGSKGIGVLLAVLVVPAAVAEQTGPIEEVVVTGSRIRQDPLEQRLPVLTLGQEDYRASGATSLADYLQQLPIAGSAINRTNNSSGNLGYPPDGGGIGAGAAEIDLRYLSSKRVLVLVDGRRWIKGSSGSGVSGAVDLNSVPANAIQSIEILQDGASAVYGSDAIGGVVNIITADDYDSFRLTGSTGAYDEGDGETYEVDVRFGGEGERGRALLDVSYIDQKSVNTADRSTSQFPLPGFESGVSSGTPEGRFVFCDPSLPCTPQAPVDVTPDTVNPTFDPANPTGGGFHAFGTPDRFNYQPFNHLVTPNERVNIFGKAEYDLSDNVSFRTLISFNNRKSQGRAAPVPLFFGPDGGSTPYMVNLVWPANHPYNPFGVDLDSSNLSFIGRRPIEAGPRIFNQDVDTWYVSAGLDGNFQLADRNMYWDVTAIWAENNATQEKLNQFNARHLNVAMGDPNVCATLPGCVPIDIVGAGSMTPEMLEFVTYTGTDTSQQDLTDFSANLSGELIELPAGPLGFAVGYEHREEDGSFTPDPVVAAGETADVPTQPTSGGYDVDEVYGEVVVPILSDAPLAHRLDVSGALRWSDSDVFASETVGKVAVNWGPTENLTLRASFSEGFRAPNIGELFNLGSRFDAALTDRCSNVSPADAANCAALGVPPGYVQLNPQISVDTGGNPDLQPETSDSYTLGLTWDLPVENWGGGIEGLLLEVNYYDIEVDGAIQAPDSQDVLDGCINTLEARFCDAIIRTPGGTITNIEGVLQNIGGIETNGMDFNVVLDTVETDFGRFRFQLMTSLLFSYDELFETATGTERVAREGTELGSPTRAFVENKTTLNTDWFFGDWFARLSLRYLSSLDEQCVGLVADFEMTEFCSDGADGNQLDSVFYTDVQASWRPSGFLDAGLTFTLGVENLFDEEPPICFSCDLNSLDGTVYPIAGQFLYARISYES